MAQLLIVPSTVVPAGSALVLQSVVTSRRTADLDRRLPGDPACEPRRPHDFPCAASALDLDDADAVGVLRLGGLLGIPVGDAVGEQHAVVGVLVVLDDEAVLRRTVDREVHDPVVVHAPLLGLFVCGVAAVLLERGTVRDRVAPGDQHVGAIAGRDDHGVLAGGGDALEPEQRLTRRLAVALAVAVMAVAVGVHRNCCARAPRCR